MVKYGKQAELETRLIHLYALTINAHIKLILDDTKHCSPYLMGMAFKDLG